MLTQAQSLALLARAVPGVVQRMATSRVLTQTPIAHVDVGAVAVIELVAREKRALKVDRAARAIRAVRAARAIRVARMVKVVKVDRADRVVKVVKAVSARSAATRVGTTAVENASRLSRAASLLESQLRSQGY